MDRAIAWEDQEGLHITHPVEEARLEDEPDDSFIQRIFETDVPRGVVNKFVDLGSLPTTRVFRRAWKLDDGVVVDLDKAKTIQLDRWRAAREPLLAKLDIDSVRATEEGDQVKLAEIVAKKTALRDVTKTDLSSITNVDELAVLWPAPLLDNPLVAAIVADIK